VRLRDIESRIFVGRICIAPSVGLSVTTSRGDHGVELMFEAESADKLASGLHLLAIEAETMAGEVSEYYNPKESE
jgi:hypothetical protein